MALQMLDKVHPMGTAERTMNASEELDWSGERGRVLEQRSVIDCIVQLPFNDGFCPRELLETGDRLRR